MILWTTHCKIQNIRLNNIFVDLVFFFNKITFNYIIRIEEILTLNVKRRCILRNRTLWSLDRYYDTLLTITTELPIGSSDNRIIENFWILKKVSWTFHGHLDYCFYIHNYQHRNVRIFSRQVFLYTMQMQHITFPWDMFTKSSEMQSMRY